MSHNKDLLTYLLYLRLSVNVDAFATACYDLDL